MGSFRHVAARRDDDALRWRAGFSRTGPCLVARRSIQGDGPRSFADFNSRAAALRRRHRASTRSLLFAKVRFYRRTLEPGAVDVAVPKCRAQKVADHKLFRRHGNFWWYSHGQRAYADKTVRVLRTAPWNGSRRC